MVSRFFTGNIAMTTKPTNPSTKYTNPPSDQWQLAKCMHLSPCCYRSRPISQLTVYIGQSLSQCLANVTDVGQALSERWATYLAPVGVILSVSDVVRLDHDLSTHNVRGVRFLEKQT